MRHTLAELVARVQQSSMPLDRFFASFTLAVRMGFIRLELDGHDITDDYLRGILPCNEECARVEAVMLSVGFFEAMGVKAAAA